MYPLNDLFMSKVEQVENELRKLRRPSFDKFANGWTT